MPINIKELKINDARYRWLRNQYGSGKETYLAESITDGEQLDKYIDEQLGKYLKLTKLIYHQKVVDEITKEKAKELCEQWLYFFGDEPMDGDDSERLANIFLSTLNKIMGNA